MHLRFSIIFFFLILPKAYSACEESFAQKIVQDSLDLYKLVERGIHSPHSKEQIRALQEIKQLEPDGAVIYEKILPLIESPHPEVRKETAESLAKIKSIHEPIFHTLMRAGKKETNRSVEAAMLQTAQVMVKQAINDSVNIAGPMEKAMESLNQYPSAHIQIIHQANIKNVNSPAAISFILQMYKEGKLRKSTQLTPEEKQDMKSEFNKLHKMFLAGGKKISGKNILHFLKNYESINTEMENLQKVISRLKFSTKISTAEQFFYIVQMYKVLIHDSKSEYISPALRDFIEWTYDHS